MTSDARMEFARSLGYTFRNPKLLEEALTHSSFSNESRTNTPHNERLEFLGDSVLDLVVSEFIFEFYDRKNEGDLTKLRADLVCERTLAKIGAHLDVGNLLLLGKGEALMGGRNRSSVLADAMEAVFGAIFMDSDYASVRAVILSTYHKAGISFEMPKVFADYKSLAQHMFSGKSMEYRVLNVSGPDHAPVFVIGLYVDGKCLGKGEGRNKKAAEQLAAKEALKSAKDK